MKARKDALAALVHHAQASSPEECCGFLLGRGDDIVEAVRARNIADEPAKGFLIDAADHFAAIRGGRERGLEVIGFYHSHPASAPQPSLRDIVEFSYPDHVYAIVSLQAEPAEIRLFRFEDGNFRPVSFVTVG